MCVSFFIYIIIKIKSLKIFSNPKLKSCNNLVIIESGFDMKYIVGLVVLSLIVLACYFIFNHSYVEYDINKLSPEILEKISLNKPFSKEQMDKIPLNKPFGWRDVGFESLLPTISLGLFYSLVKFTLNKEYTNTSKFFLILIISVFSLLVTFINSAGVLSNAGHFLIQINNWIERRRLISKGYHIKAVIGFTALHVAGIFCIYIFIIILIFLNLDALMRIFLTKLEPTVEEKLQFFFQTVVCITVLLILVLLISYFYHHYIVT